MTDVNPAEHMETETIDKLYLELSQFSTATTAREMALNKKVGEMGDEVKKLKGLLLRLRNLGERYSNHDKPITTGQVASEMLAALRGNAETADSFDRESCPECGQKVTIQQDRRQIHHGILLFNFRCVCGFARCSSLAVPAAPSDDSTPPFANARHGMAWLTQDGATVVANGGPTKGMVGKLSEDGEYIQWEDYKTFFTDGILWSHIIRGDGSILPFANAREGLFWLTQDDGTVMANSGPTKGAVGEMSEDGECIQWGDHETHFCDGILWGNMRPSIEGSADTAHKACFYCEGEQSEGAICDGPNGCGSVADGKPGSTGRRMAR